MIFAWQTKKAGNYESRFRQIVQVRGDSFDRGFCGIRRIGNLLMIPAVVFHVLFQRDFTGLYGFVDPEFLVGE